MAPSKTLADPPTDLQAILEVENSITFPHFTADDAWNVGTDLRNRLRDFETPAVVNITLANQNQLLFHAASRPGTQPDNDIWVARKRTTVLRWGYSTWYMHNKMDRNESLFKNKYMLGEKAGDYAIHGGGFPIRVSGVEGIVGVIVVSGLKQEQDHQIIVEVVRDYLSKLNSAKPVPIV
ncbi:hypothetical protein AOQ84DRAFT_166635 [Glonium stellatum]|uniref:Uncharacterized protein n=1 Tax=Glonium stellatum TaxID=574774 RepID=A0A8E2EQ66_9PEZI|nr:hypothetical protein AOQ84DRAFT_166635 [Glonium stellatum]